MAGKRNRRRALREALLGPETTPETLAAVAQARERARALLAKAREALGPRHRKFLSAFELAIRWDEGGKLDMARAAELLDCDIETAEEAMNEIREVLAAAGVELGAAP